MLQPRNSSLRHRAQAIDADRPALDPGRAPLRDRLSGVARLSRREPLVALAAVAVAFQLWAAASHTKGIVETARGYLDGPRYTTRGADLTPLASFTSTQALLLARETIPPDATYAVVVGDRVKRRGEVRVAFQHWLVPRRQTALAEADWVIAYRTPAATVGVPAARVVDLGPRADAIEVARP